MKRLLSLAIAAPIVAAAPLASAAECAVDGVRLSLADDGETSTLEVVARMKAIGDGPAPTCTLDASRVRLFAESGVATSAIVETFVDHQRSSLVVADGVATASPRAVIAPVGNGDLVVAIRLTLEGTDDGVRIEVPRNVFPAPTTDGAQLEMRVRSARDGVASFGEIGDHAIKATDTGPGGGEGPRGPLSAFPKEIDLGFVPKGPINAMISPAAAMLDLLRRGIPERVLDLSPENQTGWDDVARRAFAASIHADPLVAQIGVGLLAWLGGGLDLSVTTIGKAETPGVAALPPAVVDAIGDVEARAKKRYPALSGVLLPLGRPSMLRKAIAADPMHDEARIKAARGAIARLAGVDVTTLTGMLPLAGALVEDRVPVDPPPPLIAPPSTHDADVELTTTDAPSSASHAAITKAKHAARKRVVKKALAALGVLVVIGALVAFLRAAERS